MVSIPELSPGPFAIATVLLLLALWACYRAFMHIRQRNHWLREEVSIRKKLDELRLQKDTTRDPHTDAFNTSTILKMLDLELERCRRYQRACSIVLVKVDGLENANRLFGLSGINAVLSAVVRSCGEQVRAFDMVGRCATDEFLLLLVEADSTTADNIARRLENVLGQQPVPYNGQPIPYGVRIAHQTLDETTDDHTDPLTECRQQLLTRDHQLLA